MATSRFMKLSGVTGESPLKGHEKETEVLSFAWGINHPSSVQSGTGASAGRTALQDFVCTAYVDNAYPSIVANCCGGKHFNEVTISAVKSTGEGHETFMTWTFNDVLVTGVQNSGTADAQDIITYCMQASKMKIEYKPQQKDGTLGGANTATWDIKMNQK